MANILGFLGAMTEDEFEELEPQGYLLSDRLGKAGVESTYEAVLRGSPGLKDVETDATGRELNLISQIPAQPGNSIVLSIDTELQKATTDYLQAAMGTSRNAAAVVIDVKTGEILSLVSLPDYDNNVFTGDSDANDAAREALRTDPRKPMVDHAFAEMYAPGSTFKQITGLASLQEGVANANTMITSTG
jgi:penicillin-binding protein 2